MAQAQTGVKLSDEQIENIVKRSYQYVAMYNVNQKMALAEEGMTTRGYNKGLRNTDLLDHTAQFIARPNRQVAIKKGEYDNEMLSVDRHSIGSGTGLGHVD